MNKRHNSNSKLIQSIPFFRAILYLFLIYKIGICYGVLIIWAFYRIYYFIMKQLFKLESLSPGDLMFMWSSEAETYNIMGVLTFDKMNIEGIKNLLIEKGLKQFSKLRSRLVYKYFNYWWSEVDLDECLQRIEIKNNENVPLLNSKDDLINYANTELKIRFDLNRELPYKFIIIENKNNSPSFRNILIIKLDHSLGDGIAIMNLICGLADNYSTTLFPSTMTNTVGFIYKMLFYLSFPFYFFYHSYRSIFRLKNLKSVFKNSEPIKGIPKFAISEQLDLAEYIKVNKLMNVTFNDLITIIVCGAAKKYYHQIGNFQNEIVFGYPVNLKPLPKNLDEIQITNNSTGVGMMISLKDDHFKIRKTISKNLKNTLRNFQYAKTVKIIVDFMSYYLPVYVFKWIVLYFNEFFDLTISNVPGPRKPIYYAGCEMKDIIPLFTPGFSQAFLGVASYSGTFRFTLVYDSSLEIDPNHFLDFILNEMKNIKERILSEKENEESKELEGQANKKIL